MTRQKFPWTQRTDTASGGTDALTSMRSGVTEVTGHIRLGVTYTLSGYFVFPLLARFRRSYPGIAFEFVEEERPALEASIKNGRVDLALMLTSNLADRRRIASETLYRSTRRLWLSSAHPLLARETISMNDVAQEPYVLFHANEADESARKYWAKAKVKPRVVFQTSSLESVRSMVATGFAVTILSDLVYRPWSLEGGRVETHDIAAKIPTMDMGIAWKRGRSFSQAEQLFIDYLSETNISQTNR